VLVLTIVCS